MSDDDLSSLTSCLQQHDTPLIKTEDDTTDSLMTGDTFPNSLNTNQTNIHNINQSQLPSQQVNLNTSNRMTPTPNESGNIPQQLQQPPIASNVMGSKSCGSNGGVEYMQTQNHIFVFSTALANKGADAVMNGHFPSIVAYHCAQPRTKEFLKVSVCIICI